MSENSNAASTGAGLKIETYNPSANGIFPVSSALISGETEAILVDAQFEKSNAEAVLKMVQNSGKTLKTIIISHGDPDFYFGLDVLTAAYPDADVVATPRTIKHINATKDAKIAYWGPIMGDDAPGDVIVPSEISSASFTVDGQSIEIVGLDGHDPKHTYLWVPSVKTVLGGVLLFENLHVWMADSKTAEEQDNWLKSLDNIRNQGAERIIPGHCLNQSNEDLTSVDFTAEYIKTIAASVGKADGSAAVVSDLTGAYPDFPNVANLELGAKVLMGEMDW